MQTLDFGFPIPQVFLGGQADLGLVRRTLALGERLGFTVPGAGSGGG